MRSSLKRFTILLGLMLLLAACGGGSEPTPTPTKTPAAAAQSEATATPTIAPASNQDTGAAAQPAPPTDTPQPATPTPAVEKIARVTADQINVRSGPSTADAVVRLANSGETFTLLGQSADGQWLELGENGASLG